MTIICKIQLYNCHLLLSQDVFNLAEFQGGKHKSQDIVCAHNLESSDFDPIVGFEIISATNNLKAKWVLGQIRSHHF